MDKYEYKLKLDEIETLAGQKNYAAAAEIADSINWRKVRNVNSLMLVGEAVGVKLGGGVLAQMLRTVDVECLPTDIAEKFEIDVSKMNVNETLFVRDLQLGDKQTLITRGEIPVAVVKGPDDAPAAAGEEKSPEVIKKGKEDDAAKKEAK